MPTLTAYHLGFAQALRLGERGLTLEEAALSVPADTLFAALVDACARGGGDVAAFVRPFVEGEPLFLMTSAFPRVGGVRFYPAPVDGAALFGSAPTHADVRRVKKVRFLSEALFRRATAGETLDAWWPTVDARRSDGGVFLQQGELWLTADEVSLLPDTVRLLDGDSRRERPPAALREIAIWAEERAPHVAVDRVQSSSDIYFLGRTHFRPDCGLWFGVQWRDPAAAARDHPTAALLARLLQMLQVEGLGGKRSSGNGAFVLAPQHDSIVLPDVVAAAPAWLLSRVAPRADELPQLLHDARARYQATSVAGWMQPRHGQARRRKRLALLVEGSWVVPTAPLIGQVVDVRPAGWDEHPVYRYGYGVAAGVG